MLRNKVCFIPVVSIAFLLSSSCSDAPKEEVKKEAPAKPPAPITGRQGFQSTYPSARAWAQDAVPLQVRSMNLESVKSEPGKAPLWEVTYVSAARSKMRIFTWSAVEEGNRTKASSEPSRIPGVVPADRIVRLNPSRFRWIRRKPWKSLRGERRISEEAR